MIFLNIFNNNLENEFRLLVAPITNNSRKTKRNISYNLNIHCMLPFIPETYRG